MHRKFCALFILFFVTVFAAFSQDSEWYWDQPISKIDFNGLKNVKKSELTAVSSDYIGEPFTEKQQTLIETRELATTGGNISDKILLFM